MERLPRQKYTKEFREQAVRVVDEQKRTIREAARRLAMSEKPVANWVFRARQGPLAGLGETREISC
jgi:transposase